MKRNTFLSKRSFYADVPGIDNAFVSDYKFSEPKIMLKYAKHNGVDMDFVDFVHVSS